MKLEVNKLYNLIWSCKTDKYTKCTNCKFLAFCNIESYVGSFIKILDNKSTQERLIFLWREHYMCWFDVK